MHRVETIMDVREISSQDNDLAAQLSAAPHDQWIPVRTFGSSPLGRYKVRQSSSDFKETKVYGISICILFISFKPDTLSQLLVLTHFLARLRCSILDM